MVFGCIQSLRSHLRGVNTGSNFNSISLKNHKGNIIIWIVKFFLEIGSILVAAAAAESDPFVVMSMIDRSLEWHIQLQKYESHSAVTV